MGEPTIPAATPRSPLGATGADPVTVARGARPDPVVLEHPFVPQFSIRLEPGAAGTETLPSTPNTVARAGVGTTLWLGPDEWLAVGAVPDGIPALDVSGHRTLLEIRGRQARALLARGCPLDLDARVFGRERCAQTLLARVDVILWRLEPRPDGAEDAFAVLVRSSFARSLVAWLRDAIEGLDA